MLSLTCVLEFLDLKMVEQFQIQFLGFLELSDLNEHEFKFNFQNCLNPLCSCSLEVQSTIHFFLNSYFFEKFWQILLKIVQKIIKDISHLNVELLVKQIMHGSWSYSFEENNKIINTCIQYVLDTEKFWGPLWYHCNSDALSFTFQSYIS